MLTRRALLIRAVLRAQSCPASFLVGIYFATLASNQSITQSEIEMVFMQERKSCSYGSFFLS